MDPQLQEHLLFFFTTEELQQKPQNFLALLRRRYYIMAQHVHPDKTSASSEPFLLLREKYLWLCQRYKENPASVLAFFGQAKSKPAVPVFKLYVSLVRKVNKLLEEYYRQCLKNPDNPYVKERAYENLAKRLIPLARQFEALKKILEGTIWIQDVQAHLKRLENWLLQYQGGNKA
ncbi:MAG: hypothetical protein NZM25_10705 [Leptospiraceae bacterium]|nr:hypothetical protein [Leptospiraceae bacterium]MDW8305898.1 hypothetical protein [Leptospiraceae bacterium]